MDENAVAAAASTTTAVAAPAAPAASAGEKPARLPLTSADPLAARLAGLRALFPEAVREGRVDLEKLRAVLDAGTPAGGERSEYSSRAERYGLSWAGKSDALRAIRTLTTATLLPVPGESVNWDGIPSVESGVSGVESRKFGVQSGKSDVDSGASDVQSGKSDVDSGTSNVQSATFDVESGTSIAQSGASSVQSATFGAQSGASGVQSATSGVESRTSGVESRTSGVESRISGVESGGPGNVIIEGDNLEVLKVLQHAYYGKVKLIYIDPPYNTGGDFIYPDDYSEGLGSYLRFTAQVDGEGVKLTTNVDTSGRYHSRWLTMIYPRLFLARNLLREDGVIFVSIDDHEVHNLRLVMDEIFGEENFVGTLVVQTATDNNPTQINTEHEYMVVYARNLPLLPNWTRISENATKIQRKYEELKKKIGNNPSQIQCALRLWIKDNEQNLELVSHYDNVDERGVFHDGDIANTIFGGYKYDVLHPATGRPCRIPEKGYRFKQETMETMLRNGDILFGSDETKLIKPKKRLEKVRDALRSVIYEDGRAATKRLEAFFERGIFDHPKSETILRRIIDFATGKDDLILDFFAGSGTTAQAVLELNKEDGGSRRFILVQLPEPTGREDFPTIAEITKERVRRVIQKLTTKDTKSTKTEGGKQQMDLSESFVSSVPFVVQTDPGFKVFKLAESNFAIWNPELAATDPAALAEQWKLSAENVRAGAGGLALLYELMLKSGLPLHARIETREVEGARVHLLDPPDFPEAPGSSAPPGPPDAGRLLICVERELSRGQLRAMAALRPRSVLCLDAAFKGNDALKVNAQLEFESHGIEFRTA